MNKPLIRSEPITLKLWQTANPMKALLLLGVASLLISPLVAVGQVATVFDDTFPASNHSTLNPTAASPGPLTSTRTAYEIGSSKGATTTAMTTGALTLSTGSTSSGYTEAQALFTSTPITFNTAGQYLDVYFVFTDTANTFNTSGTTGNNMQISIGLYNSGGNAPTNGTLLWNSGLVSTAATAVTGGTAGWTGYTGQFAFTPSGSAANGSAIATRPAQAGANNLNQGLGSSSGYASGANIVTMPGVAGQPFLTLNNQYTMHMRITYVNATTYAITNTLYNGAGIGGTVFSAGGWTGRLGATTASILATAFDGMEFGYRPTTSTATTLQVNRVTVVFTTPIAPGISGLTNQTVIAGNSTTLAPTITGAPAPAFQWQTNGVNIGDATNATLALNNVQFAQDGWIYSLIATNSLGSATNGMTLSVIVPPVITGLSDQAAAVGDNVSLSPTVSGVPSPTFQWRLGGVNLTDGPTGNGSTIAGSTTSGLSIANAQTTDAGTYSLVASNSAGSVTNSMNLTVSAGNVLPSITGPANLTVIQGNNGTFSASASGLPLPTLQWLDQTGTPISGATGNTLVLTNVQYSQNGFVYSIVASNVVGSVTNSAILTVIVPPAITSPPASLVVTNTQSASFTVGATGVPSVAYQWNKNGNPISGATAATYNIASVSPNDTGTYSVTITNQAGSTNSFNVTLTVNSTIAATAFSPANGQTSVCYDTPLAVTFSQAPALRTNGTIRIYNVTNSTTPVDTINLALSAANGTQAHSAFPGDAQAFNYYPVVISGSTAKIYPHGGVLTSNQTYYVTIEYGAFADPSGAFFAGLTATNIWQFSTKAGGPVDPVNPVVNADGSGDFVTVQGAVDSLAVNAAGLLRTLNIKNGSYFELVNISGKTNVTLRGQSRAGTVIYYPNNANIGAGGGTTHARMAFKVNANDVALDNLTISNSTPQGGSQAEALMIETSAKRCIVNNCEIDSRQDTILANVNSSQGYFNNSIIKGNFDYIWGGGNLFFNQCTLQTIAGTGSGQFTAARTDTSVTTSANFPWLNPAGTYTANGMSFVNCTFAADPGLGNITLAGSNGTANNNVSWVGCDFATNYVAPSASLFSGNFVFWQNSNTMTNSAVSFAVLTTLSGADPRLLAATNIPTWFYGWSPQLAPNILTNPVSQTVNSGSPATFTVQATGIPDPTYQWQHAGTNLPSATSAALTVASATLADGGAYAVVVTTPAGSATSSTATLTVNPPSNTAPVFTAPLAGTNIAINVGVNLSVACTATDSDTPAQTLIYSLLTGPSGATVNSSSGVLTWRPTVVQANSSNPVSVAVTDNGTPNLSATNNFTVTVNPLTQPNVDTAVSSAGQFTLSVSGQVGPDYTVQVSTNLTGGAWNTLYTTNPAAMPFSFTDPNGALPVQFYRILVGP